MKTDRIIVGDCIEVMKTWPDNFIDTIITDPKPLMGEFKENPGRSTPKSSPTARANHHPTVKPLSLMRYLVKLTQTPTGGIVLDPFSGSGTTLLAATQQGRKFIGIEKDQHYVEIAKARLAAYADDTPLLAVSL